jgi:hypothetical protein
MTEMMQIPFFVDVRLEVRCEAFPSPRTSDAQEQQNLLLVIGIVGDRLNNARLLFAFLDVMQSFFYSVEELIHAHSNDIARRSFNTRHMTSRRVRFIFS